MKFFQKSIKIKLIISTFFIVIVSTMLVSLGMYTSVLSDLQKSMGQRLQHVAATASLLINASDHKKVYSMWLKSAIKNKGTISEIENSKEFKSIQKTLRDIKKVNNLQQDIYTVVLPKFLRKQNEMVFMTMSKEKPYIGNSLPISNIALKVIKEKKPSYSNIYEDHEGTWISALAPIVYTYKKGKKKGKTKIVGLIEVDYDVTEEVRAIQINLLKKSLLWSTVGMLLALIITFIISNALSDPIIRLSEHTKKPIDDEWTNSLNIQRTDEIGALASSMRTMVSEIVTSRKQLEDYAHNLEEKVKERTKELNDMNIKLKCILDNLGQGLLLFNSDGTIDPLYSQITDTFLAKPLNQIDTSQFFAESFEVKRVFNVLFNEVIPFEDAICLLPEKINQISDDIYLDIKYRSIRNEDGIDKILVVITDKTYEILNEERFKQKEIETNRLMSIYKCQNELKSFILDARQRIKDSRNIISKNKIDIIKLKRHAHTIKGGASWFYTEDTKNTSAMIEAACTDISNNKNESNKDSDSNIMKVESLLKELERNLENFIVYANETLDYDIEGKNIISIEEEKLISFIGKSQKNQEEIFRELLCQDAGDLLKGFNRLASDTAKLLNKKIEPVKITTDGTKVYRSQYKPFFDIIVHYIRNMVDHGIEYPEERIKNNKNEIGKLSFNIKRNNDHVIFEFSDDGAGINLDALREKSLKMNIEIDKLNDHQIAQLIFYPDLSTKEIKTETSGLGIGMDVIKSTIESMNGKVEIISETGKGSTLKVQLPYLTYIDIDAPSFTKT